MSAIWKFLDHIRAEEDALHRKPMMSSQRALSRRLLESLRLHGVKMAEAEDRDDPSERIMDAVMARLDGSGDGRGFNGDCPKTRDEVTAIIRSVLRSKT